MIKKAKLANLTPTGLGVDQSLPTVLLDHLTLVGNLRAGNLSADKQKQWTYKSQEDLIMRMGTPAWGIKRPSKYRQQEAKQCYQNAGRLALDNSEELLYCEGYGISSHLKMPIEHAWVMNKSGQVIDVTWPDGESCFYLGVVFQASFLRQQILKSKTWGLLCNDWTNGCEILKTGQGIKAIDSTLAL